MQTTLRLKFYHHISITSNGHMKTEKGIIDGEFVIQKIITCATSEEELYYRQIICTRRQKQLRIKSASAFSNTTSIETVVDTINGVKKYFVLIFYPYASSVSLTSLVSTAPKYF